MAYISFHVLEQTVHFECKKCLYSDVYQLNCYVFFIYYLFIYIFTNNGSANFGINLLKINLNLILLTDT